MICPCCGAKDITRLSLLEGLQAQVWKVIGAVACVSTAVVGQSHLIGEPWQHFFSVAGAIAGALIAWNIKQHPVKQESL